MEILGLFLVFLPGVVFSAFSHINQDTVDITTVTIDADADEAYLYGNKFGQTGIQATYFQGFSLLWKLLLYRNELADFPDFCFSGISSSLTYLDLANNLLTAIRNDQFSGLYLLEHLDLSKNQISSIESGMFIQCNVNYFSCTYLVTKQPFRNVF